MPTIRTLPIPSFEITPATASIPVLHLVQGTTDEDEVRELVVATTPVSYRGLVRSKVAADNQGGGVWIATTDYTPMDRQQATGTEFQEPTAPGPTDPLTNFNGGGALSFDTTGQTVHITQSRSTRYRRAPGDAPGVVGTAPDVKQAIGAVKGRVEGCDIYAPKLEFAYDTSRPVVTLAYLLTLFSLTGKVNYDAPFWHFPAGTILYLGASGRFGGPDRWNINHRFAFSPNELNIDVGNGITVPEKKGWDYVWFGYREQDIADGIFPLPKAAYVEVVYPTGNFAALGIG